MSQDPSSHAGGIPASITREQGFAACHALGLDPNLVLDLRLHPQDGATVTVPVRDRDGQVVVRGRDEMATAELSIPIDPGPTKGGATNPLAEIPIYLRIGDGPEECIGSIGFDPDGNSGTRASIAKLLHRTGAIICEATLQGDNPRAD